MHHRRSATSAPETNVQRANTTVMASRSASAAYALRNHDQGQAFTCRRNGLAVSVRKSMTPSFEDIRTSVMASSPGGEWGHNSLAAPQRDSARSCHIVRCAYYSRRHPSLLFAVSENGQFLHSPSMISAVAANSWRSISTNAFFAQTTHGSAVQEPCATPDPYRCFLLPPGFACGFFAVAAGGVRVRQSNG